MLNWFETQFEEGHGVFEPYLSLVGKQTSSEVEVPPKAVTQEILEKGFASPR